MLECSSPDAFHPKELCHFGAKSLTRPSPPHRNLRHKDRRSCLPSPHPVSAVENKDKEIRAQAVLGETGQGQLCTRIPGLTLASILRRRWAEEGR